MSDISYTRELTKYKKHSGRATKSVKVLGTAKAKTVRIDLKFALSILVLIVAIVSGAIAARFAVNPSGPIPGEQGDAPAFIGSPATPRRIRVAPLPQHPWLAPQGINSMHNDSYQSDSYSWAGPLGIEPTVSSERFHNVVGSCVSSTWDSRGHMISTCVTPFGVTLVARDPASLKILARKKITWWLPIGQKFSGGVYFHLDQSDQVLLASNDPAIQLWALVGEEAQAEWQLQQSIDIGPALDKLRQEDHAVIDVMPDWQGNYWFITRAGLVGVSDRKGESIAVMALGEEGIDNALAIGRNGVFVVSDHAMYAFRRGLNGAPEVTWREEYDRGSAPKPGTMGHGSGTTPTLVGDDYVAITDNADGQVNVLVYRQQKNRTGQPQLTCRQAIFPADRGTTENSLAAVGYSLIAENNFGYQGPYDNIDAEPGLARVDIDQDDGSCRLAWENREISSPSAVPKVSLASGLVYLYTRDPINDPTLQAWYFTAVDFASGELVYKQLTGIGPGYNNHYGSMSLAENGTMYIGVLQGVVAIRDTGSSPSQ